MQKLMAECHISGAKLASIIAVHPNTVARWRAGKAEPPGAVIAYLELLAKVRSIST